MQVRAVSAEEAEKKSVDELFKALSSDPEGLSPEEAAERLKSFGPNALEENHNSPISLD